MGSLAPPQKGPFDDQDWGENFQQLVDAWYVDARYIREAAIMGS